MEKYAGIIAPTGAWETSLKWCQWLTGQVKDHGRKVLVMAPLGPGFPDEEDSDDEEKTNAPDYEAIDDKYLNQLYESIGLAIDSNLTVEAGEGGEALVVIGTGGTVESLLTLKWRDVADSEGLAVCATDNGGFAIEEYIRRQDYISEDNFWFINPLKLLIRSFKLRNLPVPEPSRVGYGRLVVLSIETGEERGNSLLTKFIKNLIKSL